MSMFEAASLSRSFHEGVVVSISETSHRRGYPIIHRPVAAPLCQNCASLELAFFDFECHGCVQRFSHPKTTISELFAILRQWTPQNQWQLERIVEEILRRGAHVDDRDGLTDMTLLHYAAKSGAQGEEHQAARVMRYLLDEGADMELKCKWTGMNALHYSVYFNVPSVVELLLDRGADVTAVCQELDGGQSLHIAASQLALEAAEVLLLHGASLNTHNAKGRLPRDCLPSERELDEPLAVLQRQLSSLLQEPASLTSSSNDIEGTEALTSPGHQTQISSPSDTTSMGPSNPSPRYNMAVVTSRQSASRGGLSGVSPPAPINTASVSAKVTLQAMGLALGDRVVVGGCRYAHIRYCGPVEFASGVWAGLELDEPGGRNDGSVDGVTYFHCAANHGVFAPINRVVRVTSASSSSAVSGSGSSSNATDSSLQTSRSSGTSQRGPLHVGTVDVSHVEAKVDTGLRSRLDPAALSVGDRVLVAGQRKGVIRYVGPTEFSRGVWYGIELDKPAGKNDGSVGGTRYFTCPEKRGVFAPIAKLQKLPPKPFLHESTAANHHRGDSPRSMLPAFSESLPSGQPSSPSPSTSASTTPRHHVSRQPRTHTREDSSDGGSSVASTVIHVPRPLTVRPPTALPLRDAGIMAASMHATLETPQTQLAPFEGALMEPHANAPFRLRVGMQVLCHNEIGFIRYIGPTTFSSGVWLGVELRSDRGKNDGSVLGQRYFTCRPGYGLMVRPSRITVRGINGAKLIPPELMQLENQQKI